MLLGAAVAVQLVTAQQATAQNMTPPRPSAVPQKQPVTVKPMPVGQQIKFMTNARFPEGVAYDAKGDRFFVSSVHTGTIGVVKTDGSYMPFYVDSTLKSSYGLKVNSDGMALLVCTGDATYSRYQDSATHKKMIRLLVLDLATGKKIREVDMTNLYNGPHFLNDLTMDKKGNLYLTDSYSPVIYKVEEKSGKASVFAQSPWFTSQGVGLNGIVFHPNGYLIVANYGAGQLFKVDVADPRRIGKVQTMQFFPGADGLMLDDKQNLVLAQNKGVNKIFRLASTDNWATAKVIEATGNDAFFDYPATVTMKGKDAFIMNAKMHQLSDSTSKLSDEFVIQQAVFMPVKP